MSSHKKSTAVMSSESMNHSRDDIRRLADELLRDSVTRGAATPVASASPLGAESVSRRRNDPRTDEGARGSSPSIADELLRASLTRDRNSTTTTTPTTKAPSMARVPASAASISRTRTQPNKDPGHSSAADALLRASLTRSAVGGSSVSSTPPPSYRLSQTMSGASVRRSTTDDELPYLPSLTSRKIKDSHAVSAADAKSRLRDLEREVDRVRAGSPARSAAGLFKASCSTDFLFLIDTTYSMSGYIDAAKNQIRAIVKDIKEAFLNESFLNESSVRIVVVGYKDHDDSPNIEFLDFTTSVERVHEFLSRLKASGGGDMPEDVLGGIRQAIGATWSNQTRCIVHIADAPPHGHHLHSLKRDKDTYYEPGSEPHHLTHESLIQQLVRLGVNYALLRINSSTDRMAFVFGSVYGGGDDVRLHPSNIYHSQIVDSLLLPRSAGKPATSVAPRFEEVQLGTTYSALRHLVVSSITASVSRTANRLSLALSRGGARATGTAEGKGMSRLPLLGAIAEVESVTGSIHAEETKRKRKSVALETAPARWDKTGWLDETLRVEGFCLDLSMHDAGTLNAMMAEEDNIKMGVAQLTIHARSKAFAKGAVRLAAYARPAATSSRFVLKSFMDSEGAGLAHMIEDMRMQALCKAFALEFNGLVKSETPIDFLTTICLQDKSGARSGDGNLSLEPYIGGEYVKYNSNGGYVLDDADSPFNQTAQAFSHFTFERSWGHFLVTDLQGVGNALTDPAVQTADPERFKLVETNVGQEGFKFFFATHECNDICRGLGLRSSRNMVVDGNYSFRETWPTLDPTVCCSNKLCRKIIRLATANSSAQFPGYHWCHACFPQLDAFTAEVPCEAPGPKHHFKLSRFFHESQGELAPSICPEHIERDTTVSKPAGVGGSLWASMKSAGPSSSISGRVW